MLGNNEWARRVITPGCYVKICSCVVFPPKTREKRFYKQARKSIPPPTPSPSVPPNDVKRILAGFCRVAQGVHISCIQIQHFFRSLFSLLLKKKQHRDLYFSHHTGRLAKFGWILTYLKISVEMALTRFVARSHSTPVHTNINRNTDSIKRALSAA